MQQTVCPIANKTLLAGGVDNNLLAPPHEELKCEIGNCFIETMGTVAVRTSFTIDCDEKFKNGSTEIISL